jgi:hypothetical protein
MNIDDAIVSGAPIRGRAAAPYRVPNTAIAAAAGRLVTRMPRMTFADSEDVMPDTVTY